MHREGRYKESGILGRQASNHLAIAWGPQGVDNLGQHIWINFGLHSNNTIWCTILSVTIIYILSLKLNKNYYSLYKVCAHATLASCTQ